MKHSPYNKELSPPWSSPQLLILTFQDAKWLTNNLDTTLMGKPTIVNISLNILCIIYDTTGAWGGLWMHKTFLQGQGQLCCWIPMLLEATSTTSEGTKYVDQVQFQPEFKDYCWNIMIIISTPKMSVSCSLWTSECLSGASVSRSEKFEKSCGDKHEIVAAVIVISLTDRILEYQIDPTHEDLIHHVGT